MSEILEIDNISSDHEVTFSPNLGLPKVPRSNVEALAAMNAITRILDGIVLGNKGGVASGEYKLLGSLESDNLKSSFAEFARVVSSSSEVGSLVANFSRITEGVIDKLSSSEVTSTNIISDLATLGEITSSVAKIVNLTAANVDSKTVISESITATNCNLEIVESKRQTTERMEAELVTTGEVVAEVGTFSRLIVDEGAYQPSAEYVMYMTNPTEAVDPAETKFRGSLPIIPDTIKYTLHIKGTFNCVISGTITLEAGDSTYHILEKGNLVNSSTIGQGFPTHNSLDLFSIEVDESLNELTIEGKEDFSISNNVDFELIADIIRFPVKI